MCATGAIVLLAVCVFAIPKNASGDEKTLQLLHIVMRHGARTPASTYPNDPYKNETFYPVGWGQLTNEGKLQLYEIGQFLRNRYGKFLGTLYSPDMYYTQSTGVDRTRASMQMVNAGLWPPEAVQHWGPLEWQPVPVNAEPLDQDSLLLVRKPCPQYHIEKQKVMESEEIKSKMNEYRTLFTEMTEITGMEIKSFEDVQDVYTTLLAEKGFNLSLPEWTKNYYPDKLYEPTVESYILNTYNDKMNRLKGGVFVKKLLNDWESKATDTLVPKERKAYLYGGHDSTIVNIMRTLKIWDTQFPGYGIMILFEMLRDEKSGEYGIEIYLRNSTKVPPFQLTLPGCENSFCSLGKVKELTKEVIPVNWDEECKTDNPDFVVPTPGGP
ncbi:unnamed protein product [Callosobruchus maculatus]|uniref:Acid phosphatase n=1 Tax=Callosobruchus maculatus TaxID=64391 RepID=A0A653BVB4_CALMS|nr:unnamed protein product [Callosobruchus maculatus]